MPKNKMIPLNVDLSEIIKKENAHQLLESAIIKMISTSNLPYYGEFALFITFVEAKIGTCGVSVNKNGNMIFYWDPEWVEKQTIGSAIFVMVHEIYHLIFSHIKRTVGYDKKFANIAQDMIINSIIHSDIMLGQRLGPGDKDKFENFMEIPVDEEGNNSALFIPKEYDGPWLFESLYKWLKDEYDKWKTENEDLCNNKINLNIDSEGNVNVDSEDSEGEVSEGNSEEETKEENQKDSTGKPKYGPYSKSSYTGKNGKTEQDVDCYSKESIFEDIENTKGLTLDCHFDDDVPEELKNEIVNNVLSNLKNRGLETEDITESLMKLQKSEKDYLKYIKRCLSNHVFGTKKQKSITKPNRRGIWGLKGNKKFKVEINCLLDTSGSMGGDFEKVLSYIFQNDISINLIQCDTTIKGTTKITNKSQLEHVEIKGLGGTELTPGLNYIANDIKLNKNNTVILTDGYTDRLDLTGVRGKVLIISNGIECPIETTNKQLKQIIINKE